MIMTTDLTKVTVGVQPDIKLSTLKQVPILKVLGQIPTSVDLRRKTEAMRKVNDKDEYTALKGKLPVVVISSESEIRSQQADDKHTGFMWADIDKCGTDENKKALGEAITIVEDLMKDYPYIIGYFISPSGNGLKVLCAIEPDVESHKMSFKAVRDLFYAHDLNVDKQTSDRKRPCFVCYDANATKTLIEPLKAWTGERIKPAKKKEVVKYVYSRSSSSDLSPDDEAGLCLQHISPEINYEEWIRVGMGLKEHGCSCGVWDSWSSGSQLYKQGECERKWASFSGSGVGFGTVVNMAKDGNGGKSPITAAKNQREPVKVTADDFEEIEVEDEPVQQTNIALDNTYYHKGSYYILDSTMKRYISVNSEGMTRQLRLLGYSNKGEEGEMSAVDKFKAHVELYNSVDACGALAGRSIGQRPIKGSSMKYLVTRKNTRTEAREGNWDNIQSILEKQYGGDQLKYLYSWLHRARYQLNNEEYNAGHTLVISGAVGGGKSLGIEQVFRPLLGGVADAERAMCRDNQFNSDLIGAELLLIDDADLSRKMEDRRSFGKKIKGLTATSGSVSCHPKGVDAFTLNPLWRLIIAINDSEDDLGSMPPLGEGEEDTIGDKIVMLKCHKHRLPFVGDPKQYNKIASMIESEIAAFAYFIDNYEIPADIKQGDSRFGFDEFHNPELLAIINQNSNDRTLLSVTNSVLFHRERYDVITCTSTGRRYWDGTAQDWSKILLSDHEIPHRVKNTIEGELSFGDSSIKAGKKMAAMAAISGGRVIKSRNNRGVSWRVWDEEITKNDSDEPF